MRVNKEYQLCRQIAYYLRLQYPNVQYRFDMGGMNLSKAQAGMNKALQKGRGWPDLMIFEGRGKFHALLLEIKIEGTNIIAPRATDRYGYPKYTSDHIKEQAECMAVLAEKDYACAFAVGFDGAKKLIDKYMKNKFV